MTPPQHLWFFTPEGLRRMGRAGGLSMLHLDHPARIVPVSLIAFQLRRMLGLRNARPGTTSQPHRRSGQPADAMRVVLQKAP